MSFIPISQLVQATTVPVSGVIPIVSASSTQSINVSALINSAATNYGDTIFYQPGWYLSPKGNFSTSAFVPLLNALNTIPFVCTRNCQVQSISSNVTTASVSGTMTFGIYSPANGNYTPGSLLLNCGTVSTAATGFATATFSPFNMIAGTIYWLGAVQQLQNATLMCNNNVTPYHNLYTSLYAYNVFGQSQANVTGSLPTTFSRGSSNGSGTMFWLQYV